MKNTRVGIIGRGAIGLAYAAWLTARGHEVAICSPRTNDQSEDSDAYIDASGLLEGRFAVSRINNLGRLATWAETLIIAIPANGHQSVIDALLPSLNDTHRIFVSAMASLSSLYLYEQALSRGLSISVVSSGTTALTARIKDVENVRINVKRKKLSLSCLPRSRNTAMVNFFTELFGIECFAEESPLYSTLSNTNAVVHVPLALFNWTRIERGEDWAQYDCMTPMVAQMIEAIDAERILIADCFNWKMASVSQKLAASYDLEPTSLAEVAAAVHQIRGGPAGPKNKGTRYVAEDVPFGLTFNLALGQITGIQMPATQAAVDTSNLLFGTNLSMENKLIRSLQLESEGTSGLLARTSA